ncbi:hypothetical protein KY290_001216 [Solanum tuberosum]|uniref:Uncharacterized protein n=1 Tax=Solanum tuberosum TaxID=4113 RepID=A0ABQ7WNG5_SOLTU|nr:hypothetical protein KY289_001345 [Solanum tuberosum]KAH0781618.1 hypothetical protein KY290_001216 [Solanum tuberosum]
MADQIVIDLVEDDFNYEEAESYQDKIDGIKEMIADLKNSSNEDSLDYDLKDSFDKELEGYFPIHATAYPNFDCNVQ